jgi:hypothetical protein
MWPHLPPAPLPANDAALIAAFQELDMSSWQQSNSSTSASSTATNIASPTVLSPAELNVFGKSQVARRFNLISSHRNIFLDESSVIQLLEGNGLTNPNVLEAIEESHSSFDGARTPTVASPLAPFQVNSPFAATGSTIFISSDDGFLSEVSDNEVVELLSQEQAFWASIEPNGAID